MKTINEALRLIRVFHDLNIKTFANGIGISPGFISDIENGNKNPSMELINKYAEYFNLNVSSILFFSEDLDKIKNRSDFKINIRNKMLKFLKLIEDSAIEKED